MIPSATVCPLLVYPSVGGQHCNGSALLLESLRELLGLSPRAALRLWLFDWGRMAFGYGTFDNPPYLLALVRLDQHIVAALVQDIEP